MINVIATFAVLKEQTDCFLELAEELVNETVKEAGCIEYELIRDQDSRSVFIMVEKWESKEHLDSHSNSDHFRRIIPQISKLVEQEITVRVCNKVF
ncbi:putative quinol monooxygenase [Mangrovibacterium sp.]|uniref:putative quinol monooxygenase n=1 Tax=Mangrovibacterium sp. TaxID=1961364 RepID=UPI0035618EF1